MRVHTDDLGVPVEVARDVRGHFAQPQAVTQVEEVWRIAEEWWREESLARTYVRALLDGGRVVTLFHDDTQPREDGWYEQQY